MAAAATLPLFSGYEIGIFPPPNAGSDSKTKLTTHTHILEVYLDYTCPFSKRIFERLVKEVIPYAQEHFPSKRFYFVFRHQIQPCKVIIYTHTVFSFYLLLRAPTIHTPPRIRHSATPSATRLLLQILAGSL
jgi:hypothetical protein